MEVSFLKQDCSRAYFKVIEAVTNDTKTFCSINNRETNFRALNNITIHYVHSGADDWYRSSSFTLKYAKGKNFNLIIFIFKLS